MLKKILLAIVLIVVGALAATGFYVWKQMQGVSPEALESKYMTPADRFVEVAGARVRVREEGAADAPPVILLHGFIYSLETWDGWAADLSRDYRVIRFDLLGHGLTGPDAEKRYSPAERAAFIGDFMDAMGIESAFIAGNSLGGLAAWRFAATDPERVKGLILVSPGAYSANGVTDTPVAPPKQMEVFLRTAPAAGVRASAGIVFADDSKITEKRLETLRDMMRRRGNGEAFVESIEEFVLPDPAADLAKIDAPTLILWGEQDVLIPVEQGRRLEAAIANARLVTYKGVGHVAQEEAPELSVEDAREFLAAVSEESS
jgi:pimeloyl-ACP methyl ester carboxylesterase